MKLIDWSKYDDYPKPLRKNKYKFIFCMLFLSILSFAVFYVGINAQSILMAFRSFVGYAEDGTEMYVWTFDNFRKIFSELSGNRQASTKLLQAFKNSLLLFFFGNLITLPVGCLLSYFLWKNIPGYKFFRTVFYLPAVLSSVVMVIIFKNIFSPNGLISTINIAITGKPLAPLIQQDGTAIWMILLYNSWVGFGGQFLLQTAALNRIPAEIVESAQLDGITPLKEYVKICIPLSWPTIYIILIQKIAGILSADGPILLFTGGQYGTTTLGYWSYEQVILGHSFEYPAAVGLMMTAVVAPIAIFSRNMLSKVYADVEF